MNRRYVKISIDVPPEYKEQVVLRSRTLNYSLKKYITSLIDSDISSGREPELSELQKKKIITECFCNAGYALNSLRTGNYRMAEEQLEEVRNRLWNRLVNR